MERDEVALLFLTIHQHYPKFDISSENIERFYEKLQDFPMRWLSQILMSIY